jgi:protein-arginine kinase activator protein McsA
MTPKEDHLNNIQLQIIEAKSKMNESLNSGNFRQAEIFLDRITSLKRLLEVAA